IEREERARAQVLAAERAVRRRARGRGAPREHPKEHGAAEERVRGLKDGDTDVDLLGAEIRVAARGEEPRPYAEGAIFGAGHAKLRHAREELEQEAADLAVDLGDAALSLEAVIGGDGGDASGDGDEPGRGQGEARVDVEE